MAFCSKCGAALPEGTKFCPECGAPVPEDSDRRGQKAPDPPCPVQGKRPKKSLLRRWWFWALVIIIIGALGSRRSAQKPSAAPEQAETTAAASPAPIASPAPTASPTPEPEAAASSESEIRPEIREFLDAYEACMDEYVEFMQEYMNADSAGMVAMMSEYYGVLARYTEFAEAMEDFDESELTNAELAYYIEVTGRVSRKLLAVAGG